MATDYRTPSTWNDVLESTQNIALVDIISHGEIVGISGATKKDQLKNVYVNNTPVISFGDEENLEDIKFSHQVGTATQATIPDFDAIVRAGPNWGGTPVEITQGGSLSVGPTENQPPVDYVYQTSADDVDAVLVTITIPQLISIDEDDGHQFGNETQVSLGTAHNTGGFTTQISPSSKSQGWIQGTVLSSFNVTYKVVKPDDLPVGETWRVEVRKRLPDDHYDTNLKANATYVTNIQEVVENNATYPLYSTVGMVLPAAEVAGGIGDIKYLAKGRIVNVPDNMNAVDRTFSGTWNGQTFNQAYTDDPFWCLLDFMTNTKWGCSISMTDIDTQSFLTASVWASERLSYTDTDGSVIVDEPRFSCNMQIKASADPVSAVQQFAGTFRSYIALINGRYTVICDRSRNVVSAVTTSITTNGFSYGFSEAALKTNVVRARFLDSDYDFNERVIEERDDADIALHGEIIVEIALEGITKESQARRHARFVIETQVRGGIICQFQTGMQGTTFSVGDRIQVLDNDFANLGGSPSSVNYDPDLDAQFSGRVVSVTDNTGSNDVLETDRDIDLTGGSNWTVGFVADTGVVYEADVVSISGARSLTHTDWIDPTGATVTDISPTENAQWWLYNSNAEPQDYEVISIEEDTSNFGMYNVVTKVYREAKYAAVDYGVILPEKQVTNIEPYQQDAPIFDGSTGYEIDGTGFIPLATFDNISKQIKEKLRIVWKAPTGKQLVATYVLRWRVNLSDWTYVTTKNLEHTIENATRGTYDIRLVAKNIAGVDSPAVDYDGYAFNEFVGDVPAIDPPTGIRLRGGAITASGDIDFNQRNLSIEFDAPLTNNANSNVAGYVVQYVATDGSGVILSQKFIDAKDFTLNGTTRTYESTLSQDENLSGVKDGGGTNGIQRTVAVKLYAEDRIGRRTTAGTTQTERSFVNAVPAGVTFDTFVNSTSEIQVKLIANTTATDLAGYFILKSIGSVAFGNATQRKAAVQNGLVEVFHADPAIFASTSAEQESEYYFYACPFDTLSNDLNHYLSYGNWALSGGQTPPALTVEIEEIHSFNGWDCRLDYTFDSSTGVWTKLDEAGYTTTSPYVNHSIGVDTNAASFIFNQYGGKKILFEGIPFFPNFDFASSSPTPTVDDGENKLFVYITLPTDSEIDSNSTLLDAGTNLWKYNGVGHRLNGTTNPKDTAIQRSAVVCSYARDSEKFQVNLGNATVDGRQIQAQTILSGTLITGGIEANVLVANSITSNQVAVRGLSADRIVANSISATELAADSVTATAILAGSIDASHVQANSIGVNELVAGTLDVADASIGTLQVAGNAVSTVFTKIAYSQHFYSWNRSGTPNTGSYGTWVHRNSYSSAETKKLIDGHYNGSGGTRITTSNLTGFPYLYVYVPAASVIGAGEVEVTLQIVCEISMKSRGNGNYALASNLNMEYDWIIAGGSRSGGSREMNELTFQANGCDRHEVSQSLTYISSFKVPTHPNGISKNTARFRIQAPNLGAYSPKLFTGGNASNYKVVDFMIVKRPMLTATMLLR